MKSTTAWIITWFSLFVEFDKIQWVVARPLIERLWDGRVLLVCRKSNVANAALSFRSLILPCVRTEGPIRCPWLAFRVHFVASWWWHGLDVGGCRIAFRRSIGGFGGEVGRQIDRGDIANVTNRLGLAGGTPLWIWPWSLRKESPWFAREKSVKAFSGNPHHILKVSFSPQLQFLFTTTISAHSYSDSRLSTLRADRRLVKNFIL
jgi:hypothetical protein